MDHTAALAIGESERQTFFSFCVVCEHQISKTDAPWDNEWRCLQGCRPCRVMIGCIPERPAPDPSVVQR